MTVTLGEQYLGATQITLQIEISVRISHNHATCKMVLAKLPNLGELVKGHARKNESWERSFTTKQGCIVHFGYAEEVRSQSFPKATEKSFC